MTSDQITALLQSITQLEWNSTVSMYANLCIAGFTIAIFVLLCCKFKDFFN